MIVSGSNESFQEGGQSSRIVKRGNWSAIQEEFSELYVDVSTLSRSNV